jgi:hypothetical protein
MVYGQKTENEANIAIYKDNKDMHNKIKQLNMPSFCSILSLPRSQVSLIHVLRLP